MDYVAGSIGPCGSLGATFHCKSQGEAIRALKQIAEENQNVINLTEEYWTDNTTFKTDDEYIYFIGGLETLD